MKLVLTLNFVIYSTSYNDDSILYIVDDYVSLGFFSCFLGSLSDAINHADRIMFC
jgi:hypothetical protein